MKKQKPIAASASAWWPGGRAATKTESARPETTTSVAASASAVARSAASKLAAEIGLSGESKSENAPSTSGGTVRQDSSKRRMYEGSCTRDNGRRAFVRARRASR